MNFFPDELRAAHVHVNDLRRQAEHQRLVRSARSAAKAKRPA